MQVFLLTTFLLHAGLIGAFSIKERRTAYRDTTEIKDCISMQGFDGQYRYISPGTGNVCGIYLVGDPDTVVDIVFHDFDVNCDDHGLVALVDGWEAKREFFPGSWDSKKSLEERYLTYCGTRRPRHFRSSQNVALIQHRIPSPLQAFSFTVHFIPIRQPVLCLSQGGPARTMRVGGFLLTHEVYHKDTRWNQTCNALSMDGEGTWTLHNYGEPQNCSFSMMSPHYVQVLRMDVGVSTRIPEIDMDAGIEKMCSGDQIEFLGGVGLDPSYMWLEKTLCGRANRPRHGVYLPCPHVVVRLVSSGYFANKVTIRYRPLTAEERDIIGPVEC